MIRKFRLYLYNKVRFGWRTCPECGGSGFDYGDGGQCDRCGGLGEINE